MNAKEKLFIVMDEIKELELIPYDLMTEKEKLELQNLEVKKMQYWSEWKD